MGRMPPERHEGRIGEDHVGVRSTGLAGERVVLKMCGSVNPWRYRLTSDRRTMSGEMS